MSEGNGLVKVNCPLDHHWSRISSAMDRSETSRNVVGEMASKVAQLDRLPDIAAEIRSLNRNNTILLIFQGIVMLALIACVANMSFKGSFAGSSVEMGRP